MVKLGAKAMFTIGEFSKISGISVRTLRFYHEKRLLVPASITLDNMCGNQLGAFLSG